MYRGADMSDLPQKHPFLRARTSYFEAWVNDKEELPENHLHVRELTWREFNQIKNHPEGIAFFGRDPFYDVFVATKSPISKGMLRDLATDIYKGLYRRVEYSLKRDA